MGFGEHLGLNRSLEKVKLTTSFTVYMSVCGEKKKDRQKEKHKTSFSVHVCVCVEKKDRQKHT